MVGYSESSRKLYFLFVLKINWALGISDWRNNTNMLYILIIGIEVQMREKK